MQMCLDLSCVCSHLDKTTTWHDPRLSQLQSAAAQHPIPGAPAHAHSLSNPAPTTQAQNINPETGITLPPPPLSLKSTDLLLIVQLHQQRARSLLGVISSGFLFPSLHPRLWWLWLGFSHSHCRLKPDRGGTLRFDILMRTSRWVERNNSSVVKVILAGCSYRCFSYADAGFF